jgi:hypothetical protein
MSLYALDTDTLTLHLTGHPKVTATMLQHPWSELVRAISVAKRLKSGNCKPLNGCQGATTVIRVGYQR